MNESYDRLMTAYFEHGEDAVKADPELAALLASDPELQATFDALSDVDRCVGSLPELMMPAQLEREILRRASERGLFHRLFGWIALPSPERALVLAALLLVFMPPFMVWLLIEQRSSGNAEVLDLVSSSVTFDLPLAMALQGRENESDAGDLIDTTESPSTLIVPRARHPRALEDTQAALLNPKVALRDAVHVQSLLNAFSSPMPKEKAKLEVEVGEAPWRRETLLVRVFVAAGAPITETQVTLAFNPGRVKSFRRLADAGMPREGAQSGAMAKGDAFTAMYEIVATPSIGPDEPLCVGTLRYKHEGETLSLRQEGLANASPSRDFRFAAAVAYFALEARGELGQQGKGIYDRIASLALRAIDSREDRKALLSMIASAANR
jgi:hypothetical protein